MTTRQAFPIADILKTSIALPIKKLPTLAALCWPYIVLTVLLSVFANSMQNSWFNLIIFVVMLFTSVLAAVSCHQVFLCSAKQVSSLNPLRWSEYDKNFFISGLKLMLALFLVIALVGGFFALLVNIVDIKLDPKAQFFGFSLPQWLAIFVIGYPFARVSFILPGAAVGRYFNFNLSWHATKPYSLQLFASLIIVPTIVTALFTTLINTLPVVIAQNLVFQVAVTLLSLIGAAIELCILSKSFEWVTAQMDQEQGQQDDSSIVEVQ